MGKRWKKIFLLVTLAVGIADYIYLTQSEMRHHRSANDLSREEIKKIEDEYNARREQYLRAKKFAEERKQKEQLSSFVSEKGEDHIRTENRKLQELAKKLILESQPASKEPEKPTLPPDSRGEVFQYLSKEGDTLLSISERLLGSPDKVEFLIHANPGIVKADKIPSGTVIRIPSDIVEGE